MADAKTLTDATAAEIGAGLVAIDTTVRASNPGGAGAPGSGLFYLLDQLAVSTLGVPRSTFPPPAPPPEADSTIEAGQGVDETTKDA